MGERRKQLVIHLDVKKLNKQRLNNFIGPGGLYLGGAICVNCNSDTDIRRITAGANAWRKGEGVIGYKQISRKREGTVLTPVCMYG